MPTYEFISPDGKPYEIAGPEGSTREQAFEKLQSQLKQIPAAPKAVPVEPRSDLQQLGHKLGLGARYALETIASPVTGTMDAVSGFMKGAGEIAKQQGFMSGSEYIAKKAGMTPEKFPETPSATGLFRKGLIEMGFPETQGEKEKRVETVAEIAPAVVGGGALVYMGGKAIARSDAVKKLTDLFTGAGVKDATAKAESAVSKMAEQTAKKLTESATKKQEGLVQERLKAADAANERVRLEEQLKRPLTTQSLGQTGQTAESSLAAILEQGSKRRAIQGDKDFAQVSAEAAAREAKNEFVNTKAAVQPLKELQDSVKDVPELQNKVSGYIRMMQGEEPKTFKNLEVARRYLNDVSNGVVQEGFGSIGQRAAKNAVKELDKAMADFAPSFTTYKNNWRNLSQPLNIQATKLGRVMFDMESRAGTDIISKTPAAKIPEKLFSSKENIELYTEALAGGRDASAAAKAEAAKTVENLALKYFEEITRNKKPAQVRDFLQESGRRDVIEALPGTKKIMEARVARGESAQNRLAALEEQSKMPLTAEQTRKATQNMLKARNSLTENLYKADVLAKQPSLTSQRKAVTEYTNVLDQMRKMGQLSNAEYEAMSNVLGKIPDMQERAAKAAKLARGIAYTTMGVAGATGISAAGYYVTK